LGGLKAESGKFCVNKTSFAIENVATEIGGEKTVIPISVIFAVT
jgi:hypothetical protein